MDDIIDDMHDILSDCKKNKVITYENAVKIDDGIDNVINHYENKIIEIVDKMTETHRVYETIVKKGNDMYEDEIKQLKTKLCGEREKTQNIERIRKGKILIRQIENDRFYNIALKYKPQLDTITIEDLMLLANGKITRPLSLNEHIGAKLAYSIICRKINVPEIPVKFCCKYIEDNDEMHPDCKPLEKVMNELRIFEKVIKTLKPDECRKYNVEPETITEEIQFFIDTEKK